MSLPQRRQRSTTTTPLEDANEAIKNSNNNLSDDDRYQLLSDSLAELSEEDRLSLVEPCINSCWIEGLLSIIGDIPVEVLDTVCPILIVVDSNFSENQAVRLIKPLLLKGCNVNHTVDIEIKFSQEFVSIRVDGRLRCSLDVPTSLINAEYAVTLSQYVVHYELSNLFKLLLPKLDCVSQDLALVEAFGSNRLGCCRALIDYYSLKNIEMPTDCNRLARAVALCCAFEREELLEMLLNRVSESVKNVVRNANMLYDWCCVLPPDFKKEGINALEAALLFNHPRCVKILLANQITAINNARTLGYCASNAIRESVVEFIAGSPHLSSALLKNALDVFLRFGGSLEVITILIERLKQLEGNEAYLSTRVSKCAASRWWRGLHVLVSGGTTLLGNSDLVRRDLEGALIKLVTINPKNTTLISDIIKALSIFCAEMNLGPALFAALANENLELLEFFLSLDNNSVNNNLDTLKQETENEECLKLIDDASSMKVKLEVKEEAEEEEEDQEDNS